MPERLQHLMIRASAGSGKTYLMERLAATLDSHGTHSVASRAEGEEMPPVQIRRACGYCDRTFRIRSKRDEIGVF